MAGGTTFLQAGTANEVLKAQERRIRLSRLKGELVERARAETLMFRLAREERDGWVTWPARVGADADHHPLQSARIVQVLAAVETREAILSRREHQILPGMGIGDPFAEEQDLQHRAFARLVGRDLGHAPEILEQFDLVINTTSMEEAMEQQAREEGGSVALAGSAAGVEAPS